MVASAFSTASAMRATLLCARRRIGSRIEDNIPVSKHAFRAGRCSARGPGIIQGEGCEKARGRPETCR